MRRLKPWTKRTSLAAALVVSTLFGGCAPAAKPVFIDTSRIATGQTEQTRVIAGPRAPNRQTALNGSVGGRAPRLLEEKEGIALWNEAREILAENRIRSRDRLRADLERKYMGESRARAIDAERANETVDDAEWESTLDEIEALMERFAGEKTELAADLAGRIGFPDKGQPVPRRRHEEVFYESRTKKVEALRARLKEIDAQFETQLSTILVRYEKGREARIIALMELDYAGDLEAIARADAEAREAIRKVIGRVDSSIPQLQKRLDALAAVSVKGQPAQNVNPRFPEEKWTSGLTKGELEKYANVFVKSRGYVRDPSPDATDATQEFSQWLKKNAVSR